MKQKFCDWCGMTEQKAKKLHPNPHRDGGLLCCNCKGRDDEQLLPAIAPEGERAKRILPYELFDGETGKQPELISRGYANNASVQFDWHNDRLQFLVLDGQNDDPALHVRLNSDGSIAEILIRDDLRGKLDSDCGGELSAWQKERDGHGELKFSGVKLSLRAET